jgi:hypothetical protein
MKANNQFLKKPKSFWAYVRSLSQALGYSKKDKFLIPTYEEMEKAFQKLSLNASSLISAGNPTELAKDLEACIQNKVNQYFTLFLLIF